MEILYLLLTLLEETCKQMSFVCGQTDICITEHYIMKVYALSTKVMQSSVLQDSLNVIRV